MSTRMYKYDAGNLQNLFAGIIESLGSPDLSNDLISQILGDVCRNFRFGCGFVYEADYTGSFILRERHARYEQNGPPESFRLESLLTPDQLLELREKRVIYRHMFPGGPEHDRAYEDNFHVFGANSFMLVPIIEGDRRVIGLVGILDRRGRILLDDNATLAAKTVLTLLANHVKLRIYWHNLEYSKETLAGVLDNLGIDIYVNDYNTHEVIYVNRSMAKPYGGVDRMLGSKCYNALYKDKAEPCEFCPKKKLLDEEGNPTKVYSWDYQRPFDGMWFRVLSSAFRWIDGRMAHSISSIDITESKRNEELIFRMAYYDPLTGLPNRRKLSADCENAMRRNEQGERHGFLLFFDLDHFKKLNDGVGHQAGDELLRLIGDTLLGHPLTRDNCYRHGGDEFVLLYPDAGRERVAEAIDFLLDVFNRPWRLKDASPICRVSVGVARYPDCGGDPEALLHSADMLMYKAKQMGRGIACFYDGDRAGG